MDKAKKEADYKAELENIRKELLTLYPNDVDAISKMGTEQLLDHLEKSTLPALLGSWDQTRISILNLMVIVANLRKRDSYQPYIEGLASINDYMDSHKPAFVPGCKHFQVVDMVETEVNGCCFKADRPPFDCNKHVCPLPNEQRPEKYQVVDCPWCGGSMEKPCPLCHNLGKVEKGKICPTCGGKGAEPIDGEDESKNICIKCARTGINPSYTG